MRKLSKYLETHPKTHLIFDLDSTLAKLLIDWSTYRNELWKLVSSFDDKLTNEIPCKPFMGFKLTNAAIKKHGIKTKKILDQFNGDYELSHYTGYLPHPDLLSFIRSHHNKLHFFLWTNNAKKTIADVVQKEKLNTYFQKIITRDDVLFIKPEVNGYNLINTNNTPKDNYVLIGDSIFDEETAHKIGIDFFQVNYFSTL